MEPALLHLTERVRAAQADKTPLQIRCGGSKDFYGQALRGEILDMSNLTGIVSYEPSELVVTVRAGTSLLELESVLAEQGQCLPFEPPHFSRVTGKSSDGFSEDRMASCGGMVAAGLSGPARSSVGGVRDFMLGVTFLNGQAELLTFGGQVMKNVAGYDVSRLMVGSLGTLGVITEISLKVLPKAPAEATLIFEMNEAQALKQLNLWAGLPLPMNATCWHAGALMVRLRGAKAAVTAAKIQMGGCELGDESQSLWQGLREQSAPFFELASHESLIRISVPDTAPPLNLGPTLIEWGGAQRWIKVPNADLDEYNPTLTLIHGQSTLFRSNNKVAGVFSPLSAVMLQIHKNLKKQFDPAGIFNPGRIYADF